jgi:hypothetical protein
MPMALLEILKDQSAFGFTGKINLLAKTNGQFQAAIYQSDGQVVDAEFQKLKGKKALYHIIYLDVEGVDQFQYVVEPEIISANHFVTQLSYENLKLEAEAIFQKYIDAKKLRPPGNLKLIIDPEIVVNNDRLSKEEFQVLLTISDWSKVSDIYINCTLLEYEVTDALVSLRRKKAIKVFQS